VRTVLLVPGNEGLRSRLAHTLGARSVFFAASDEEALKERQKKLPPPTLRRLYSADESEPSRCQW
jgi:hypothetical protein